MSLSILGMGTATPEHYADQVVAAEFAQHMVYGRQEEEGWFSKVYELSTVEHRGSILLGATNDYTSAQEFYPPSTATDDRGPSTAARMQKYNEHASTLGISAARQALFDSNTLPDKITHLITVSCTGFGAPGIDLSLIEQLGLSPGVSRLHVGFMGCHAAINALMVARAIGEADRQARILLCCVELCSLHYSYGWNPSKMIANALFADGAGALVAGHSQDEKESSWSIRTTASQVLPDSRDAMGWQIGDHGFEMILEPNVPDLIFANLRPWLEQWLAGQDLCIADIGSWAIHPGGPRIIHSVAMALGLSTDATEASRHVLSRYGNMSSATVLFVVQRLQQQNASRPCVALAFGPGLVVEAALFD